MRAMALLMITTILVVPLAGCVDSGDGPQFELSPEEIEDLIDANLDDFLNNSSLTIVNNNYENNTYNNGGSLYSSSGTMAGNIEYSFTLINETFLIRGDAFPQANTNSAYNLASAKVCVGTGTNLEASLAEFNTANSIGMDIVPVADEAESTTKLVDGSCDAMIFSSQIDAEQKKNDLETTSADGTTGCDSCDLWITGMSTSNTISTIPLPIGNSMMVYINQSKNEMLTGFEYLFAQITLYGLCDENESNCEPFEHKFSNTDINLEMITKCSEEVEFMYSRNLHQTIDNLDLYNDIDSFFPGTGLDCEHKISFMVSSNVFSSLVYEYDIEEGSDLILSWSDWTYSLIWESVPIEN